MELRVNEVAIPEKIDFNYEELKAELTSKVSFYETLVYPDDQIKDAKKLADVLISVKGESRPVFALMVESMLIGAELAEKGIARTA